MRTLLAASSPYIAATATRTARATSPAADASAATQRTKPAVAAQLARPVSPATLLPWWIH